MSALEFGLLVLAGLGAGLIGSIAGLASLISYPALLATGLSPVSANVTNTVALVLSGVGAVSASRPELTGQRARLVRLGPVGLLGGVVGAVLLLSTPSGAFEKLVPVLIAGAAIAILVQRPPRELAADGAAGPAARDHWSLVAGTFAASVYAGYFGAAAGVLLLAVYLLVTGEGVPRSNALKNVVLGLANGVAALGYAVFADVAWLAALPLAIGFLLGGRLGPRVVRRVPQTPLRRLIAVAGLALAVHLGLDAFG
ncbi:sulfite exporter TauE/SafE family protein [Modestobacter sp. VKM Ac-2985]|uniref:sulfite exporter TauE/SafE family protein n=1 Tax=Modestobacter sp. VKM Ac-2985 TaxID=3004139 RepID=UPI0022AB5F2E|nr:sulfite exporter TauE/SafE family protein [Modestobacter sp. VKM Ac-2985]MCZ2837544.1 sulfite exporter TauE/SafE family protein [Modestobacter sp. VKM Ac-2985]